MYLISDKQESSLDMNLKSLIREFFIYASFLQYERFLEDWKANKQEGVSCALKLGECFLKYTIIKEFMNNLHRLLNSSCLRDFVHLSLSEKEFLLRANRFFINSNGEIEDRLFCIMHDTITNRNDLADEISTTLNAVLKLIGAASKLNDYYEKSHTANLNWF